MTTDKTVCLTDSREFSSVTLLLSKDGKTCCIYADRHAAEAKCDMYNAYPFIDGEPDSDAPYRTETWVLFDRIG